MIRIFKSLFIALFVAVLAIGATGAWYTAQDVEAGNTFATGKLVFDIRGHGGDFPTAGVPVNAVGMVPGLVDETYFEVYNHADSTAMKYKLYAGYTGGSGALYNMLKYKLYKCDYPVGAPSLCTTWVWRGEGWLKDLLENNAVVPHDNNVNPNGTHRWKLELWLDTTADNSYQGLSTTFNIIGKATQPGNPGWSE